MEPGGDDRSLENGVFCPVKAQEIAQRSAGDDLAIDLCALAAVVEGNDAKREPAASIGEDPSGAVGRGDHRGRAVELADGCAGDEFGVVGDMENAAAGAAEILKR